ncbi:MAG: alpha/beta fold hydrolase [Nitrospirota bacterium]|nr:MAG: alpha/beta fold hydrolase [Nitrospirota bacterium]
MAKPTPIIFRMEITQQALSFQDSDGHLVAAILTEPPDRAEGIVLLCHGFLSTKQSNTNRRLTELLVPQGISTFGFDWFGMGESGGAFADITLGRCCDQLERALAFITCQGYQRIGLIGSSFGGLISLLVAGRHPHLLALGLKCPVLDFPELLRLEFGVAAMGHWKDTGEIPNVTGGDKPIALRYDFYEDCLKYDAYQSAETIISPTLIVHGDQDELIPLHQIQRLVGALATEKKLCILQGANHYFGKPEDFRKMTTLLGEWMKTHLTTETQYQAGNQKG